MTKFEINEEENSSCQWYFLELINIYFQIVNFIIKNNINFAHMFNLEILKTTITCDSDKFKIFKLIKDNEKEINEKIIEYIGLIKIYN